MKTLTALAVFLSSTFVFAGPPSYFVTGSNGVFQSYNTALDVAATNARNRLYDGQKACGPGGVFSVSIQWGAPNCKPSRNGREFICSIGATGICQPKKCSSQFCGTMYDWKRFERKN